MTVRKSLIFSLLIFALLWQLAIVSGQDSDPVLEALDPPEMVRVAYVPIQKFATMYVAQERGLFEKYGLEVEIERVGSGTEAIAFLSEGQIDVGGIAIVTSLWNGWNQGLDIRIIAPGGQEPLENSPTRFLVREDLVADGTVTEFADLEGMVVAVAGGPGSGGEYLLSKALEQGGLTIFDVETQSVGNADMPAAFANDAIAASIAGAPFADQIIDAGDAVSFAEDLTPGLMTVAFVGSGNFVTERPEVAQRFVLALTEAARLMQGEGYFDEENMAAYLAYTNSTEESIMGAVPFFFNPDGEIPVDGLEDIENTHRENGRTEYEDPIDLETVVDTSFTETALELLGEYEGMDDMDDEPGMESTEEADD